MRATTVIRLSLLGAALMLLLAAAPAASARQACASPNVRPPNAARRELVRATLCLLNQQRSQRGLRRLRLNRRLAAAARRHVRDMTRRRYFSHTSLSGVSFVNRIRRTGYLRRASSWVVGENLAWGTGDRSTPRATVDAWMRSSGHRANILTGRFREIGIAIGYRAPMRTSQLAAATYATEFGACG